MADGVQAPCRAHSLLPRLVLYPPFGPHPAPTTIPTLGEMGASSPLPTLATSLGLIITF